MNKETLFNAMNTMAAELEIYDFIPLTNEIFVPMVLPNLAAVAWLKKAEETTSSKIVREQLENLWVGGAVKLVE